MDEALLAMKENLIGHSFRHFSLDEHWRLRFDNGLWLVAQNVASVERSSLDALLVRADPPVLDAVDPEWVAMAALVCRNMRRDVTDVALDSDGTLELTFDAGRSLRFLTDFPIVDWQWCVNDSGGNPYSVDCIAACLFRGRVELDGARTT